MPARDGLHLTGRVYEPNGSVRTTLLALPGIGVPQRVFRHLGPWMAAHGARLVSVDYRGIGESIGERATASASLTTWAQIDAVAALDYVRREFAPAPVLLAHSFGGQALGLADELHAVSGAILVGSQLGHPRHWDGFSRFKMELLWRVLLPTATALFEPVPKWLIGEPLPKGVAQEWGLWGRSDDWLLTHFPDANARFARFSKDLLAYTISDDDIAPPRAASDLLRRFTGAKVTRIDISPFDLSAPSLGHIGLFRPAYTARVWERWLEFALAHSG